jgi:hypothetical protein
MADWLAWKNEEHQAQAPKVYPNQTVKLNELWCGADTYHSLTTQLMN